MNTGGEAAEQMCIRDRLGSTQTMGAGTNVQDRLIAIHKLDCPWRPSDLEQRQGRIERQGNMFPSQLMREVKLAHDTRRYRMTMQDRTHFQERQALESVADRMTEIPVSYTHLDVYKRQH